MSERAPTMVANAATSTDAQLLAEYNETRSAEVFGRIVERHSPMVYATCLRILRDPHAAEDAAQATFLVLMRKLPSMSSSTFLPGWLYSTAQTSAKDIQRAMNRRAKHERVAIEMSRATLNDPAQAALWEEIKDHVDRALELLPAAQRDAILLRYLYGYSEADAARELNCSEASLHQRVARGMAALRERLQPRRAGALSAVALGAMLTGSSAHATPPAGLAASITKVCAGKAVASAAALATAKNVGGPLFFAKAKLAAIAAVVVIATSIPIAVVATKGKATQQQPATAVSPAVVPQSAPPASPKTSDDGLPPGCSFLFKESFALTTKGWHGELMPSPTEQKNVVIRAVEPLETDAPMFFGEVRSPMVDDGWTVGAQTYLRFKYLASGFRAGNDCFKLMVKDRDELNYGGWINGEVVNGKWTSVILKLDSQFPFINKPRLSLKSGMKLHGLVVIGYAKDERPDAGSKFYIDDVMIFEAPAAKAGAAEIQTHTLRPNL